MNAEVSPNAKLRGTRGSDFEEENLDIALLVQATFNLLCDNASIIHCTRFKDTSIREREREGEREGERGRGRER